MCQLALDMFGQTLNERNIAYSFRYENYARMFHKKCSECQADPYLPLDQDLIIHGLAWSLPDMYLTEASVGNFRTICIRCAVTSREEIGFWIPMALGPHALEYFMFDGETLGADSIAFTSHPDQDEEQELETFFSSRKNNEK